MHSAASLQPSPLAQETLELAALSDPTLDPLFWPAERVGVVSAWWGHVPFAFWLVNVLKPRLLVELGTHRGVSYSAFCEAVRRGSIATQCFAIDTWRGDEHAGLYDESIYSEFREFHDERYSSFSTMLRGTFDDAVNSFSDRSIDLLHLDGLHTRQSVEHDFKTWLPKLSDRCVVLIHDTTEREGDFGVWQFWAELAESNPTFEFLHGHGLGLASVGSQVSPVITGLCSVTDATVKARIRERFASTGERWITNMRERHTFRELGQREAEILDLKRSVADLERQTEHNELTRIEHDRAGREAERNRAEAEQKRMEAERTRVEAEIERERDKTAIAEKKIRAEASARIELKEKLNEANLRMQQRLDLARDEAVRLRRELEAEAAKRVVSDEARIRQGIELLNAQLKTAAVSNPTQTPTRQSSRDYVHFLSLIARLRLQQLRAELALKRSADAIRNSAMFDAAWYQQEYRDVAESGVDPATHFVRHGAAEGRNPSPAFDSKWYLQTYPDVAAAGINPLVHYLVCGAAEGRETRPIFTKENVDPETCDLFRQLEMLRDSTLFDLDWYLEQDPDLAQAGVNPYLHYLTTGANEGRDPGPDFDSERYLQRYPEVSAAGLNPLLHYIEWGQKEGREYQAVPSCKGGRPRTHIVDEIVESRYPELRPIPVYLVSKGPRRLTVVTDSISSGSVFGGVGTALILSALLAQRMDADLRLLTRTQPPELENFRHVLAANGITWNGNVERICLLGAQKRDISVSDQDVFLTTSWWTTRSVAAVIDKQRIVYLLQEDERMFYPYGDQRMRCQETLADPDVRFVVNSELLLRHFATGADVLENIRKSGLYFEPAFPNCQYFAETESREPGSKNNFFFYARPDHYRNLYWRGLEALSASIEEGILAPEKWDFYFVGRSIGKVVLPGNVRPKILENLSWAEYGALVRRMDLGLSLMDTPHPSYPPLDLAASGAVVVTNRHGIKNSLTQYSPNILCSDTSLDGLKSAVRQAATLADDRRTRFANYANNGLCRDWATSLEPVLQSIAENI